MAVAPIHEILCNHHFQEVVNHLNYRPEDARILNLAKQTPLAVLVKMITCGAVGIALSKGIRKYVVGVQGAFDALLKAFPRGVANVDKYGDTALIIACRNGNMRSIDFIMECGYQGKILHWISDRMIGAYPTAASIPDQFGTLPIHIADIGGGSMEIIKMLARANPASLAGCQSPILYMAGLGPLGGKIHWDRVKTILDINPSAALAEDRIMGHTTNPIKTLWSKIERRYVDDLERVGAPRWMSFSLKDDDICNIAIKMTMANERFFFKAKNLLLLLLKAAYHGTTEDELPEGTTFLPVHAATGLFVPEKVIQILAYLYPRHLSQTDNENGWTPLHVAVAEPWHSRGYKEINYSIGIKTITAQCPGVAQMVDKKGRLPIHLALESGISWESGIDVLFSAAPNTLTLTSGQSRLCPFQEAAVSTRTDLNTVYSLLVNNPAAVHC